MTLPKHDLLCPNMFFWGKVKWQQKHELELKWIDFKYISFNLGVVNMLHGCCRYHSLLKMWGIVEILSIHSAFIPWTGRGHPNWYRHRLYFMVPSWRIHVWEVLLLSKSHWRARKNIIAENFASDWNKKTNIAMENQPFYFDGFQQKRWCFLPWPC